MCGCIYYSYLLDFIRGLTKLFGRVYALDIFNTSGIIVVNDPVINKANFTLSEWLLTARPGLFGLVGGWANPTGVSLLFVLVVMFVCSQSFVRRRGSFKVPTLQLVCLINISKIG